MPVRREGAVAVRSGARRTRPSENSANKSGRAVAKNGNARRRLSPHLSQPNSRSACVSAVNNNSKTINNASRNWISAANVTSKLRSNGGSNERIRRDSAPNNSVRHRSGSLRNATNVGSANAQIKCANHRSENSAGSETDNSNQIVTGSDDASLSSSSKMLCAGNRGSAIEIVVIATETTTGGNATGSRNSNNAMRAISRNRSVART